MSIRSIVNASAAVAAISASLFVATSANAYQVTGRQVQPESRAGHRITVEASVIHHVACNGHGENGGRFFVYQYTNRPGFRAILPPNWSNALGGRDWPSFQQAAAVACRRG